MPDIIEEGDEVSYHRANMPLTNKLSNASNSDRAGPSSSTNYNGGRPRPRPHSRNGLHSQSSATTEASSRKSSSSQSTEGNSCHKSATSSRHSSPSPDDDSANLFAAKEAAEGEERAGDEEAELKASDSQPDERLNQADGADGQSEASLTSTDTNRARIWQEKKKDKNYVESFQCTTLPACLVLLQLLLGATITTFGFVMLNISPTLKAQDTPYWAGIPLLLTGLCGLYFCAASIEDSHSGSLKTFIIKAVCFALSTICLFINVTASAFTGIHGGSIVSANCQWIEKTKICQCSKTAEDISRIVAYQDAADCEAFLINLETYLFFQCALNAIAGCTCFSLIFLMWSSKFSNFHSGLRFYSYSAGVSSYPRANSSRYSTTLNFNTPKSNNRYSLSPSLV